MRLEMKLAQHFGSLSLEARQVLVVLQQRVVHSGLPSSSRSHQLLSEKLVFKVPTAEAYPRAPSVLAPSRRDAGRFFEKGPTSFVVLWGYQWRQF